MPATAAIDRAGAEREVMAELDAWRSHVIPDAGAPLDAEDIARLVPACFAALGIDPDVGRDFSVNTVHYYRRKDIIDAPTGRTSAARYGVRHLWQAVGARLAGALGLVTLAEARRIMRGADERTLVAFVAARVLDARARGRLRGATAAVHARPLPGVATAIPPRGRKTSALVIALPGDAWCVVPASHPAHQSPAAARELVAALAQALDLDKR